MNILETIHTYPVIPVYYNDDADTCIDVLKQCYAGGIRVFEFVNRGEKALENFKILLEYKNQNLPDLRLGIGTIKTAQQAKDFAEAGTEFLVSPIVKAEIAAIAKKYAVEWIPGCMTPTEIALAEELEARGHSVVFAGTPNRLEANLVPEAGYEFVSFGCCQLF